MWRDLLQPKLHKKKKKQHFKQAKLKRKWVHVVLFYFFTVNCHQGPFCVLLETGLAKLSEAVNQIYFVKLLGGKNENLNEVFKILDHEP